MSKVSIYRVIDANLNRLREGVRVSEEVFRFIYENESLALSLKKIRHEVMAIEQSLDEKQLLLARDSSGDMFSAGMEAKESSRKNIEVLLKANLRRSQEAARVLEEFLKMSDVPESAETAKVIRFTLYQIEKEWSVHA